MQDFHFNPRPPWGGRRRTRLLQVLQDQNFNPRPPWGGRPKENSLTKAAQTFQSTPSVGRATALTGSIQTRKYISIHALRGEGDTPASAALSVIRYFNPRPPWGGRHRLVNFIAKSVKFQSTPSVGRATFAVFNLCHFGGYFNPRPPWGGRPIRPTPQDHMPCYFNPRPPWGGRPYFTELIDESSSFQSPPSVGRATKEKARIASAINRISIHALRGEGDRTR